MKWTFNQTLSCDTSVFRCEVDAESFEEAKEMIFEGGYVILEPVDLNITEVLDSSEPKPKENSSIFNEMIKYVHGKNPIELKEHCDKGEIK